MPRTGRPIRKIPGSICGASLPKTLAGPPERMRDYRTNIRSDKEGAEGREEGAVEKWSEGVMLINPLVTGLSFPGKISFGAINSDDASSVLRHSRLPPLVFPPLSARHSRIYSVPCCAREADPKSS